MSFDLNDYVDVAERIRQFNEKHPEGSLQSELEPVKDSVDNLIGWLCKAYAYRSADDPRPGVGHAYEPVPGKTPYTRDSEAMNAETSAWGRAIIALGFPTKKIASKNEVRARQEPTSAPPTADPTGGAIEKAKAAQEATGTIITEAGDPRQLVIHFGKNKGKTLGELGKRSLEWYANTWEPNPQYESKEDRALKMGSRMILGLAYDEIPPPGPDDDDIPF